MGIIHDSLAQSGVNLIAEIRDARPNCPREDLFRIADSLRETEADVVISFGGGSAIDAVKAAEVLRTLNGDIDAYFGTVSPRITSSTLSLNHLCKLATCD